MAKRNNQATRRRAKQLSHVAFRIKTARARACARAHMRARSCAPRCIAPPRRRSASAPASWRAAPRHNAAHRAARCALRVWPRAALRRVIIKMRNQRVVMASGNESEIVISMKNQWHRRRSGSGISKNGSGKIIAGISEASNLRIAYLAFAPLRSARSISGMAIDMA